MKLIMTCVLFIAFSVITAQSPPNDLVENAIEISSFPYVENQINFIDASTGRDDPHDCIFTGFSPPERSIYYKFTATKDIDIKATLNIDGVNLDNGCGFFSPKPCAIIIFYSAPNLNITDVNNLTSLSSCNNHSNSTINVKAGNHYYIGIYSVKTKGLIDLNISELNGNISDEKEILLNFYQSTGGDNWKNNMNWKTSTPLKDWFGITVNEDNKVTKIDLHENNLKGVVPLEIANLSQLDTLYLYKNNLFGEIPKELGKLSHLKELALSDNKLFGNIPQELGDLSKLKNLYLHVNNLTGSLPKEIGNLSNLEFLSLEFLRLTGKIPKELGNLTNLIGLSLKGNFFTGEIPKELGNLQNLELLFLSSNEFSGSIPIELTTLTSLISLRLTNNKITGEIPKEFGSLNNLVQLWLANNQLTGAISNELTNMANVSIDLYGNNLSGSIPDFTKSEDVYLYIEENNFLFGDIENTFGDNITIEKFEYVPQKNISEDTNISTPIGSEISLDATTTGTVNNYQWYKGDTVLNGETNPILEITIIDDSYFGEYHCKVSNTIVTGLTLTTGTFTIKEGSNIPFTNIPDNNFEQALLDLGLDDVIDGKVKTANISSITSLDVGLKNINDLTGIEDFVSLKSLKCWENNLTHLDVSNNLELETLLCSTNQLTELNISNNVKLISLNSSSNNISTLDVSQNVDLETLYNWNTQISSLDISKNPKISTLDCRSNSNLTTINLKNGNNTKLINPNFSNNPNLTCILVDNATYSYTNWTNIDPTAFFVETQEECNTLGLYDKNTKQTLQLYPNPTKKFFTIKADEDILKVELYDLLGKRLATYKNSKIINIQHLNKGVYFAHIFLSDLRKSIIKVIKE